MRHFDFEEETPKYAWPFRVCLANRMFHPALNTEVIQNKLLLSGLSIGTRTYFPFLFTCVWPNFNPFKVSLQQHEMSEKKRLHMKHRPQNRGKSAWGKTICLQMVLPKKHYCTYAHAGGPRHTTQTDVF